MSNSRDVLPLRVTNMDQRLDSLETNDLLMVVGGCVSDDQLNQLLFNPKKLKTEKEMIAFIEKLEARLTNHYNQQAQIKALKLLETEQQKEKFTDNIKSSKKRTTVLTLTKGSAQEGLKFKLETEGGDQEEEEQEIRFLDAVNMKDDWQKKLITTELLRDIDDKISMK